MSHLQLEELARLVEEQPDDTAAAHLGQCIACREELEALREQSRALARLPDGEPPVAAWTELRGRLRREGLIVGPVRTPRMSYGSLRVAAGLLLFVLGGATGLALRGDLGNGGEGAAAMQPGTQMIARGPQTREDAETALRTAEAAYFTAMARYSELAGTPAPTSPVARLVALEGILATTRAALEEAPADPVINGYHMTAEAQRDATLRLIASTNDSWF